MIALDPPHSASAAEPGLERGTLPSRQLHGHLELCAHRRDCCALYERSRPADISRDSLSLLNLPIAGPPPLEQRPPFEVVTSVAPALPQSLASSIAGSVCRQVSFFARHWAQGRSYSGRQQVSELLSSEELRCNEISRLGDWSRFA